MNTGLLDQLNTYFSDLDTDQGPVTADQVADLLENVRELPPTPVPVRSRPKIWVAIVAAAVTILVVASIPLLFRSGTEEGPPATEPVTSTTTDVDQTDTTTAELPLVTPAPTVEWQTISFDGESGPLSTSPVYTADGQFIVYDSSLESDNTGGVADLDGDLRTVLWRSPDGLDWERFHLSEFDGLSTQFVGDLTPRIRRSTPLHRPILSLGRSGSIRAAKRPDGRRATSPQLTPQQSFRDMAPWCESILPLPSR
jgi:hypothetical protein